MSVLAGITTDDYHADDLGPGPKTPTASNTNLQELVRFSPAHAYAAHPKLGNTRVHKHSTSFDLGHAVHELLLEGSLDRIVEVAEADWKKKTAQAERDAARAAGMIPLLVDQADRCREMIAAVRAQLAAFDAKPELLDPAGRPEVPIVWEENGVRCRALIDWLHPSSSAAADDVKTTGGNGGPEVFSRNAFFKYGYDFQAAFYRRGIRAVIGREPAFRFVVIEAEPPFEVAVYEPGPDVLAVADAKVDFALRLWAECLASGIWPGYPKRVATIELPPWEYERWTEREARDA